MAKKKGLGRGLGALMEMPSDSENGAGFPLEVRVEAITANPQQPRARISEKTLKPLAESIKDKGVLEPLVVRRSGIDQYELIAGERRLRASKLAGLERVPVIVREADPLEMLEIALIENLHREDLNPLDEAESYRRLSDEFNRTQEEIARLSGRDRSTVANLMRLLALPGPVQEDIRQGRLTTGHARALLALENEQAILSAREQILMDSMSVRAAEQLVKRLLKPKKKKKTSVGDEAYFKALSERMTQTLGSKVRVVAAGRRKRIEISFSSNEELERLMKSLGVGPV